jgi:hypothetical protein
MIIQYKIPSRRSRALPVFRIEPTDEPLGHPPRVARLVALAHKLEALVRSGEVRDYVELARLGHVSPARVAQIVLLGQLAPDIQEYVLFLSAEHAGLIGERQLRDIAREPRWDRQRARFQQSLGRGAKSPSIAVASPGVPNCAGSSCNSWPGEG